MAGSGATEAFVPAIAPSNIETTTPNEHYKTAEEYVFAIADAMREEYKAIVDAGFLLQIDDPFLVTYYIMRPDLSIAECRKWAEVRVEALNTALQGHSRPTACASTPATASTWARASTTCSSRTSSTSSSR